MLVCYLCDLVKLYGAVICFFQPKSLICLSNVCNHLLFTSRLDCTNSCDLKSYGTCKFESEIRKLLRKAVKYIQYETFNDIIVLNFNRVYFH